jgi:hypothetical protein
MLIHILIYLIQGFSNNSQWNYYYAPLKVELIKRGYVFILIQILTLNLIEEVQKNENIKLGKAVQIALNQVVVLMIAVFDKKNQMKL